MLSTHISLYKGEYQVCINLVKKKNNRNISRLFLVCSLLALIVNETQENKINIFS